MTSDPLVNRARMRHANELRWAKLGTGPRNFRGKSGNGVRNLEDELGDGPGEWRERNPAPAGLFDDDE